MTADPRAEFTPSSALPLAYFGFAHAGLLAALGILVLQPDLPSGFFYHPRMVALVHLVTLAWLSGSILGAFYIVAPLVLRMAFPVRWPDWACFVVFVLGTVGMVSHFWLAEYRGMVWGAWTVTAALAWVAGRAWRRLPRAAAPWPVKLHVALAFANILGAAALGLVMGIDRTHGHFGIASLAAVYSHAHLAAIGWATMMVIGIAYRLIPMMLPAAMPEGSSLARSAILLEAGVLTVGWALLRGSPWLSLGAVLVVAGLVSFALEIRRTLAQRRPKPPALPGRDWSTWQAHGALLWLVIAAALGLLLAAGINGRWSLQVMWVYGVAGLVGFLAQIVAGIQGRLVPMYAWYRAMARRGWTPPERSAHALPSASFARTVLLAWTAGVPLLAAGLAASHRPLIALGAGTLAVGVAAGWVHITSMMRKAGRRSD